MKGPFGMLLIGGGIILIVGLFTGKIHFGAAPAAPAQNFTPSQRTNGIAPTGGKCPTGWILIQGKCYDPGASGI